MSPFVSEIVCVSCRKSLKPTGIDSTCADCGPDDGILEIRFDLDAVQDAWRADPLENRSPSHWRYRELLPIDSDNIPDHWPVGWTPLIDAPRLAGEVGVSQLLLKDEGRNPTASMKDRASSVAVAHAIEHGEATIACASTGNAATSLAGHAALAGMDAVIFVPQSTAAPKLAQLLVYGATVFAVQGPYENAYRLCTEACDEFGWYNRNCAINPVLVEGKKTCGLEIAEQCRTTASGVAQEMPDWIAVSIGDGCTIAGIWKGLSEMYYLGVIDRLPRLLGVQAAAVAPIDYALKHGRLPTPDDGTTLADGINVQVPRNWRKAISAVRESEGTIVRVTDEEILAALARAGRHGVFAEPAAAASVAGVVTAVNAEIIRSSDRVLAVITGSGLKDTDSAMKTGARPIPIEPTLDAVTEALKNT